VKQMKDGDHVVFDWSKTDLVLGCCKCGLEHRLRFDVKKKKLLVIVFIEKKKKK
jgi:hypothetical protein